MDSLVCQPAEERWFWFKHRCGRSRDCLGGDNQEPFRLGYCNALGWCRKDPGSGRFVEVWDPKNEYMLFKMTERNATYDKVERCVELLKPGSSAQLTFGDDPSPYTIQIPGLSDILRVPGIDNADTRRERAARMARSHSPLPVGLQWVPKLLNKLDDAQDLLYTALAIGLAVLKFAGVRSVPGLGILLTLNDLLNGVT